MRPIVFQLGNNRPAQIFAEPIGGNVLRLTNLPIFATKTLVGAIFLQLGPLQKIEIESGSGNGQFDPFIPKIMTVALSAQALLNFEEYDGRVLRVSKRESVLSKTDYLAQIHATPLFPTELVSALLKNVEDVSKPELPATEHEIFARLNREKSFRFYRFQVEQEREGRVELLRANEEQMYALIREQKRVGVFEW